MANNKTKTQNGDRMLKFKRLYAGCYEANHEDVYIEIEKTETSEGYWTAMVTRAKYGEDRYKEINIQAQTKKELVEYCNNAVKYMDTY